MLPTSTPPAADAPRAGALPAFSAFLDHPAGRLLHDFRDIAGPWARARRDNDLPRAEAMLQALRAALDQGAIDATRLGRLLEDVGGSGASLRLIDDALTGGSTALLALTARHLARLVTAGHLDVRSFGCQLNADGVDRQHQRVYQAPLTSALMRGDGPKVMALCQALLDEVDGRRLTLDDVADIFDQHVHADRNDSRATMLKLVEDERIAGISILDACARLMATRGMPVHRVRRLYMVDPGPPLHALTLLRNRPPTGGLPLALAAYDDAVKRAHADGLLSGAGASSSRRVSPAPATR
ncbi:hypothetical protein [Mitsuaria sp. GD03876]|uniref:hypothetical protein n=1 Tax=Mitsuaria sp. GD03876 TaxID=2975399 RepID=UPI0024496DAE|nr:hypothetical protein [Mitsuaria sp. GD03876]MDH0866122.1 hypothetical protein [Mitsuaria sp. GD03876]